MDSQLNIIKVKELTRAELLTDNIDPSERDNKEGLINLVRVLGAETHEKKSKMAPNKKTVKKSKIKVNRTFPIVEIIDADHQHMCLENSKLDQLPLPCADSLTVAEFEALSVSVGAIGQQAAQIPDSFSENLLDIMTSSSNYFNSSIFMILKNFF